MYFLSNINQTNRLTVYKEPILYIPLKVSRSLFLFRCKQTISHQVNGEKYEIDELETSL